MKTSNKSVFTFQRGRPAAGIAAGALLLSLAWSGRAQFNLIPGTDALNIYFFNGISTYGSTLNPTPYLSQGPGTPVDPSNLQQGSERTSTFFSHAWPGAISGSYSTGLMSTANSSAQVNYVDTPVFGSNSVAQTSLTPVGMNASILNPGSGIAELRLDWTAEYSFGGASGTPVTAVVALPMGVTVQNWMAVAGQISFYDVSSSMSSVAAVPLGGDFYLPTSTSYPSALHAKAQNATFFGLTTPGLTGGFVPYDVGSTINPANGDVIEVVGFVDILVDPGSVQVSAQPAPSPGITSIQIAGTNLIIEGTNGVAGVTYVVCRSTSATAPLTNWVPVQTNLSSTTGNFTITATNAVAPANSRSFYVLRAE
jgi:hypothetical protein